MPANVQRNTVFLGWDRPLLLSATEWLLASSQTTATETDDQRGGVILVLPTAHAKRRIAQKLPDGWSRQGASHGPPQIITAGDLPEFLYSRETPNALEFEQTLAWTHALRGADRADLTPLVPQPPATDPVTAWTELATTIRRLHEDLAAHRLTFADVVAASETEAERRRWSVLDQLLTDYRERLRDAGLADPHTQRQRAIRDGCCRCDHRLVLIGTGDLTPTLTEMLRQVDTEVTALVAAPPDARDRFDEFGGIRVEAWLDHHLPLRDSQLIAAGDMPDQSSAAAEALAEFGKRYSAGQCTIGLTDESLISAVESELRICGVPLRRNLGWSVAETAVGSLLRLTADYVAERSWSTLAPLVRHNDVHHFLQTASDSSASESGELLERLDAYLATHFPVGVDDPPSSAATEAFPDVLALVSRLDAWLQPLDSPPKPLGEWCGQMLDWLKATFRFDTTDSDEQTPRWIRVADGRERTRRALLKTTQLLQRFRDLNLGLDIQVSGAQALEMLSQRLADLRVSDEVGGDRVALLGWLDLALDDSPALVVVGLNHPYVPETVTADPFLPGGLRTELRMTDNDRRYARDVYAMHQMICGRSDARFIVGRRGPDASPTPPSRLLAAAEPDEVARRVRRVLKDPERDIQVETRWDAGPEATAIPIPTLPYRRALNSLSVTSFKEFLTCPYRFYLRRVLGIAPVDDSAQELAANQFGDLVHDTLEAFGRSPERDEKDSAKITDSLIHHLRDVAGQRYGDHCRASVAMQVLQAEQRLVHVALRQAARRADGWKIIHVEKAITDEDNFTVIVDGEPMRLRGRFDRIDRHETTGQWAVLDYKTHGHLPEKQHIKTIDGQARWVDLQLPLYRLMLPGLDINDDPDTVELGYFNISDKESETKINIAEFSNEQLEQAEDLIFDCIRRIRSGDFAPTDRIVEYDDYEMILQTGVASRMLLAEEREPV